MHVRVTLFAVIALAVHSRALIDEAVEIIKLGKEIGEEVLNSWDVIGKPFNASGGVDLPVIRRKERLILSRLALVTRAIDKLQLNVDKLSTMVLLMTKGGSRGTRLELKLHETADLLARVSTAERQMKEYVRLQYQLERTTLEDFATWCVSHEPGALMGLMERVYSLIVPPHKFLLGTGLLDLVVNELKVCYDCRFADKLLCYYYVIRVQDTGPLYYQATEP